MSSPRQGAVFRPDRRDEWQPPSIAPGSFLWVEIARPVVIGNCKIPGRDDALARELPWLRSRLRVDRPWPELPTCLNVCALDVELVAVFADRVPTIDTCAGADGFTTARAIPVWPTIDTCGVEGLVDGSPYNTR